MSAVVVGLVGILILAIVLALEAIHKHVSGDIEPDQGLTVVDQLFTVELWLRLLGELGYAFLIASVVAAFIEAAARREQTGLLEEVIDDISSSVLQGVYSIRHRPAYVKAVVNSCLAVNLIRTNADIVYTISEFTPAEATYFGLIGENFLKVDAEISYDADNIGNYGQVFEGWYAIPEREGKAADFARATYIKVAEVVYDADDLAQMLVQPGHSEHRRNEKRYRFGIPVNPEAPVRVTMKSRFVKERSDNEMFSFLLPTIGVKIRFIFEVLGLEIGASARMATNLPDKSDIVPGRHVKWDIEGPLLPYNTVTIWWQTKADSGRGEIAGLLPAPEHKARNVQGLVQDQSSRSDDDQIQRTHPTTVPEGGTGPPIGRLLSARRWATALVNRWQIRSS